MRLTTTMTALAAVLAAACIAAPAAAQEVDVAFNVALTSDYVFRGVSQTDEDPGFSGGVDLTYGSFYAGAWASNVDFGDDTSTEVDLYGGFRSEVSGFAVDFGVIGYLYAGEPSAAEYDYVEFKAAVSRAIGPVTAGLAVYVSPDFFGADDEAVYTEGNIAFSPADKWTLSGALGHQSLDVSDDYTTWNAGVSYAISDIYSADVRYIDTDLDGVPIAEERVVATIKAVF